MSNSEDIKDLAIFAEDYPNLDHQAMATIIAGNRIASTLENGLGGGVLHMGVAEALVLIRDAMHSMAETIDKQHADIAMSVSFVSSSLDSMTAQLKDQAGKDGYRN